MNIPFKKFNTALIKIVQKNLLYFLLFLIYFIGFGLTKILILIFKRKMFSENKHWQEPSTDYLNEESIYKPY